MFSPQAADNPIQFEKYAQQDFVKIMLCNAPILQNNIHLVKMQMSPVEQIAQGVCETHDGFTLHSNRATHLEALCDGELHTTYSQPGGVSLVPHKVPMGFRWDEPVECFSCLVPHERCWQIAADYTHRDPSHIALLPRTDFQDTLTEAILWNLLHELESGNRGGRLYIDSLVHTLIVHTLVHSSSDSSLHSLNRTNPGLSPAQARRIREFVEANYHREIDLAELAALVNFSPDYFLRQFKRSVGTTPHQYLTQIRVEQAKRLLEQGQLSVGAVAAEVGFYDQSHLAHHFKRAYGVAPKIYVESLV